MKKKILLFSLIAGMASLMLSSYHNLPGGTGGVDGTGALGPGGCNCHGHSTTIAVTIQLDSAGVPVTRYVAGMSYTIRIAGVNGAVAGLPDFGFQVAAVLASGAGTGGATNAGTLASTGLPASCANSIVSGTTLDVVEQTAAIPATTGAGALGSTYVESIPWTAPATGTGSVVLYGVINAVNNNGSSSGDHYNSTSTTITELIPGTSVAPISGASTVCVGSTITLSDITSGGTWTSGAPSIASVSSLGVVTGAGAGTAVISYTVGTVSATTTITVNPLPVAGSISGGSSVCAGSTITLSDVASGGTWSSSGGAATVSSGGVVTGVSGGAVTITYSVMNSCGTATATHGVTVNPLPNAGVISGASAVCIGSNITLTDTTSGGTWTSSGGAATVSSSGVVTGVSAGTVTISYTVANSCGSVSAVHSVTVTSTSSAGTILGPTTLCSGSTITLSDLVSGGTWSASSGIVTIGGTSGIVMGMSAGTVTITYAVTTGCGAASTTTTLTVGAAPSAGTIAGSSNVCVGSSITLTDATAGGTWTTTGGRATVGATTGVVTGMSAGTAIITYTVSNSCGTATATYNVAVNSSSPSPILGSTVACGGSTTTLSDAVGGGVWSTSNPSIATVSSSTGVVTGVAIGTCTISYTYTNSCGTFTATSPMTVSTSLVTGTISGLSTLCRFTSITLSETVTGGVWTSSSPVASVTTGGVVTGLLSGTATISYVVTGGCGTAAATHTITVSPTPNAGVIDGNMHVCVGGTNTLTDTVSGGTWTASSTNATIDPSTGVVTGVSLGTETITYTVINSCGTAISTRLLTVNPMPSAGIINSSSDSICLGHGITLTETVSGGIWSAVNGNASVVSTSGLVTGNTIGSDTIIYSVTGICATVTATKTVYISTGTICTGVLEINGQNIANDKITIYPNPSKGGSFIIEIPQTVTNSTLTITDLLGKTVETRYISNTNQQRISFNINNIATGTYFVKLVSGDTTYVEKLVIY